MRKADREIFDPDQKAELLERCDTIRLGLYDGEYPYVVPLSFGFEIKDGKPVIYFHCAKEGKKIRLLKADSRVCVEADILNGYTEHGDSVTADYESVIGFGRCVEVYGGEAVHGLELLLKHCKMSGYSAKDCVALGITAVFKIETEEFTGKRRFKKA